MAKQNKKLEQAARGLARELSDRLIKRGLAEYDIGMIIDQVITQRLWSHWPGGPYADFKLWCWDVLHFKIRKAQYLRKNYLDLSALCSGPEESFANTKCRAMRLGWTKLSYLLQMSGSEMELIAWIDRVEEENLREIDLKKLYAFFQQGIIKDASTPLPTSEPASFGDGEGDGDGESSGESGKDKDKTKRIPWKMTFACQEDLTVFADALEVVRRRTNPGMGLGQAAALMATSYLSHLPRSDEGGLAVEIQYLLEAVERHYGVRLEIKRPQEQQSYVSSPDFTSF